MDVGRDNPSPVCARLHFRLLVALFGLLLAHQLAGTSFIRRVEQALYDVRVRLIADRQAPDPRIVILAIDEESVSRMEPSLGRWPWPRAIFASILDYCDAASVVAFDVLFPERDLRYAESDRLFIRSLNEFTNVINAIYLSSASPSDPSPELKQFEWNSWRDRIEAIGRGRGVVAPALPILQSSDGVGHVNPAFDEDGVIRQFPIVARYGESVFPSLSLVAALKFSGLRASDASVDERGRLRMGSALTPAPMDRQGQFRFCPSRAPFKTYSFADIVASWQAEVAGEAPYVRRDALAGKIVFVGSLATGLLDDKKVTSLSTQTAGVEILATVTDNLLNGVSIVEPPAVVAWLLIALLALLPAASAMERPSLLLPGAILVGVLYVLAALVVAIHTRVMLPVMGPLLAPTLVSGVLASFFWRADRTRRARLETLDRARNEFTRMLVHDMRNHLGPLMLGVDLIQRYPEDPDACADGLTAIETAGLRLLSEINALLDVHKMEAGHLPARQARVSPRLLLDEMMALYDRVALRNRHRIVLCLNDCDGVTLRADAALLQRVLENLVWNAIKYAEDGSNIDIAVRRAGKTLEFLIGNRGSPIAPEQQAKLFQAFQAGGKRATLANFPSSGIGLTFCKMVMDAHQGDIRVESPWPAYGDGVMVILTLPFVSEGEETNS